jgi:hypothetical protein
MPEVKRLITRLLFSSLPADWSLCAVSIDWQGEPLILLQEGKPRRPAHDAGIDATIKWLNTPPKRHHLIRWENASANQLTFENPTGLTITNHVQPLGDGWLIAEGRGGLARVFDKQKNLVRSLDLGDAIEQINTTPDGHISNSGVSGMTLGQTRRLQYDPTTLSYSPSITSHT